MAESQSSSPCQAVTIKGTPCTRAAKEGNFCWQHNVTTTKTTEFPEVVNTRKENTMNTIAHFLREVKELEGFSARVVTNMPFLAEEEAYEVSRLSHTVQQIGTTERGLLAVDIGSQTMPLFVHRAVELGIGFRFMSVNTDALKENPEYAGLLLSRSNFAWANADSACFIKFDGVDEWGLEPLGLITTYHTKLAKRLNEVARVTSHEFYGEVSLREFTTPDGMEDSYFDGANFISQSFADALGFKESRGNIRILTPLGLIKGDCFVVPGENLGGVDVVYHTENLKSELKTDGWYLTTCMAHAPSHELRHDDQSRANFSHFITHDRVVADLNEMMSAFESSVAEGEIADYLELTQRAYSDPISVDYERFGTAQRIEEMSDFLSEIGIAPASFANIPYVRLNAIKNMMDASRHYEGRQRTNFFDRMAIPASNAMEGAVVTYEAMTLMGGVEFTQSNGEETFLDERYGVIMPGSRFATTYALHGGWDLDDSVSDFRTMVYCSDAARLTQLVDSGVLDPQIIVPGEKSEAVEVGLMIRRPNGPGEYSIEALGAFGFYHPNGETVEVVDLADAPYDVDTVFGPDECRIPDAVKHERYTRQVAGYVIDAQMVNPGVGGFINLLMSWNITFGVGTIPSDLIGRVEDVVDAVQQGADIGQFAAIRAEVTRLWQEFARLVVETQTKVDRSLWMTRIPEKLGEEMPVGLAISEAGLLGNGRNTHLQAAYNEAIQVMGKLAITKAAEARSNTPLHARIMAERFGPEYRIAARDLYNKGGKALRDLQNEYLNKSFLIGDNAVMKRAHQTEKRLATEALMDRIVKATLARETVDPHKLVLALYKYIVSTKKVGTRTWEFGLVDQILVQPSSKGTPSMMHLFVEAMEVNGILIDIVDPV